MSRCAFCGESFDYGQFHEACGARPRSLLDELVDLVWPFVAFLARLLLGRA